MKKFKGIAIIIMISIVSMMFIGCSKDQKSILGGSNTTNTILDTIQDKYYIDMPEHKENGVTVPGKIYYFKDEKIIMEFIPNFGENKFIFDNVSTKVEGDAVTYKIKETSNNDKTEMYVKVILDDKNELKIESSWTKLKELKLLDKEKCMSIIKENFDEFQMSNFTEEFNKKFNLDIDELGKTSNKNSNTIEKISSKDAENLVRKLLNDNYWATNGTTVINSKEYYAVEETEVGADFRYLVDVYTSEVFVETADNIGKLIPFEKSKDNNSQTNSANQSGEFTVEKAIDILQANGYYQGRDYDYVKGDCVSRDIETGEIVAEIEDGMKTYSFLIDREATTVFENGTIKTPMDY